MISAMCVRSVCVGGRGTTCSRACSAVVVGELCSCELLIHFIEVLLRLAGAMRRPRRLSAPRTGLGEANFSIRLLLESLSSLRSRSCGVRTCLKDRQVL